MVFVDLLTAWQVWAMPFGLAFCKELFKCIVWRTERAETFASLAQGGAELCWVGLGILFMAFVDPLSMVREICVNRPGQEAVIFGAFLILSVLSIAFHKASKSSSLQASPSLTLGEVPPGPLPHLPRVLRATLARVLLVWQLTRPLILILLSWAIGLYTAAQAVALAMPTQAP